MAKIKISTVMIILCLFLTPLVLLSCNDSETPDNDHASESELNDNSSDYSYEDNFLDLQQVSEIRIEIDPEDWDVLRKQRYYITDVFGEHCTSLAEKVYTYFPADVTINGEKVENVAIRKKGFIGSQSETRPSLKIKFSEYDNDLRFHGIERITLNNNLQDKSNIKQCLSYGLMAQAGLPAPRCSFAHVFVNGMDLGIYANVEPIKKPFLRRYFSEDSGNLYEGTLADFRDDDMWLARLEKKTNEEEDDWSDVETLISALEEPDSTMLEEVEKLVDIDAFLRHWAMEVLTGHWDGYVHNTNNFYIYNDPEAKKIYFIPWGTDGSFNDRISEQYEVRSVMAKSILAQRLYQNPETQTKYINTLKNLLDTIWDPVVITKEIVSMHDLLKPHISEDEMELFEAETENVKRFIFTIKEHVLDEISDGAPEWNEPLREPFCFINKGTVSVEFLTTWDTLGVKNPFLAGTCTFDFDVEDISGTPKYSGAMAGTPDDPMAKDMAIIAAFVYMEDTTFYMLAIMIPVAELKSNHTITIAMPPSFAFLSKVTQGSEEPEQLGWLETGTLTLTRATAKKGRIIKGSFSGPLWGFLTE